MAAVELQVLEGGNSETVVGTPAWATKVRRQAKTLSKTLETTYMELGRILYQVYDTPINGDPKNPPVYRVWGYESFSEYAEKELHLKKRKAEYLRNIFYRLEVELAGMPEETKQEIVSLGWTKVRELVKVLTLRNAAEWAERSKNCTYPELVAAIQEYKTEVELSRAKALAELNNVGNTADSPPVEEHLFADQVAVPEVKKQFPENFMLYAEQKMNVSQALARAKELSGSDIKSYNLDLICMDFLATNDFTKSSSDQKARYLAKMESILGLKIVAIDPSSRDLVYGHKNLAELIEDSPDDDI